jgi:hypothetical protein
MPTEVSRPTVPTIAWLNETHLNERKIALETKTYLLGEAYILFSEMSLRVTLE